MSSRFLRTASLFLCMICIGSLLLTACTADLPAPTAYRVVCEIHVVYHNSGLYRSWHFYTSEKLDAILTCLRLLDPYGTPQEDPTLLSGSDLFITLAYSDGDTKVYHQRDDRFLQIGDGPWKRIDSDAALRLDALLATLVSDEQPGENVPCSPPNVPSSSTQQRP